MSGMITIALAGNPNAGKTTIFNNLTGSHQHVGNYPGVTVEKKEGKVRFRDYQITVIDLPGTYSLTAYSPEEVVARNVLLEEDIDIVVNIVDATNIERNLILTTQLMELGAPLVIALNMVDMSLEQGISIDLQLFSQLLGVQVVPVVGRKNTGTTELLEAVVRNFEERTGLPEKYLRYSEDIETQLREIANTLPEELYKNKKRSESLQRWISIKLLENDRDVVKRIEAASQSGIIMEQVKKSRSMLQQKYGQEPEMTIVEGRYAFVRGACREAVSLPAVERVTTTDKIDRFILHRVLGLPVFLVIMWLLFQMTFTLGTPPMEWIDAGITRLGEYLGRLLPDGLLKSLLIDGVIGGVGGVIVFLPNIMFLFLGISFLEATGYMARAAFVTDKMMHVVGLHGKSFIPLILGFGCSIPAIMATRTLENARDRLATILIIPLMSCGARLPVYTLLTAAFFDKKIAGNILFSVYLAGIILAMIMAKLFRTLLLPGQSEPFVMELPAYRLPTLKSVVIQMWIRAWHYLMKAGTVILAASVIIWTLFTFPLYGPHGMPHPDPNSRMEQSYAGKIGRLIEPVIKPLGFDWKTGIALLAGFSAKEVVVSTLGTLYSIEDIESLKEGEENAAASFAERVKEQSGYTPLVAYVLMLFVLLYVPCLATVVIVYRETNSWKWPLFLVLYTLVLAWVISFAVYRTGLLLQIGG